MEVVYMTYKLNDIVIMKKEETFEKNKHFIVGTL